MGSCFQGSSLAPRIEARGALEVREEKENKGDQNILIIEGRASGGRAAQPLDWKVQGWGQGVPGRTEGYWENLEARSALLCNICTSASCPLVRNQTWKAKDEGEKSEVKDKEWWK